MKNLLLLLLSFTALSVYADTTDWMYEISFEYDGKERKVYMPDFFYDRHPDEFNEDKESFVAFFNEKYKALASITIYNQIKDQSKFAEVAGFPIHKFIYVESTKEKLDPSKIENIQLIKGWSQSAYGIDVLTKLYDKDLSWIEQCNKYANFGFDDVGCRIVVYGVDEVDKEDPDVKKLYQLIKNDGQYISDETIQKIRPYVINLKRKKIVVVELCGC